MAGLTLKGSTKLGSVKKRGPGLKLQSDMKIPEKHKASKAARKSV